MSSAKFMEKLLEGIEMEWKALGDIAEIYGGLTGKSKTDFENGNAKYVPYKNIFGNIEVNFNCLDSVKVADAENQNAIKYGDILFTGSSETAQEVGMSSSVTTKYEESIYLNSFSFGIRFNEEIKLMPEFSKYLFRCDFMRDEIAKTASGVTRFNISKTRFKKILIPIPCPENPKKSLEIQTEIVRILDNFTELTAKLTAELTAELTARKKQYKYYRDQLILNSGAKSEKLEQISEIYLGLTYTPTYTDKGVKFISARNTSSDFLDLTNVKYISEEEYKKSTLNAKPKRGDVLFTRVGSNLGHPVIVDTDEPLCMFVSLGFIRVNPKKVLNSYIKHWMNTDLFWDQVGEKTYGAAKINLNTGWLQDFDVLLPSLAEQERIVSILDKFDIVANSINKGLLKEISLRQKQYEYYRDLLLSFSIPVDVVT